MSIIQQFKDYVVQNQLFDESEHVLLAVSGGKDSVVMVNLFALAGFKFGIAHCNFNLRGEESVRDEAFVKALAENADVPFYAIHFDTTAFAATQNVSIQMAARTLRYNWFAELAAQHGFTKIAVAHHQNDVVETVLLNLTRGTGIGGLHGILPKRGNIIRPLLFLSRAEVNDFVVENDLAWVEDSSNLSNKYARNKIRLDVIPQLKKINANLEDTFAKNVVRFAEVELLLNNVVAAKRNDLFLPSGDGFAIKIADFSQLLPQKLLSYELLKPFNFSSSVVDELILSLNKPTGTSFYSPTHRITIDRAQLILTPNKSIVKEVISVSSGGEFLLPNSQKLNLRFSDEVTFGADKATAYIDAERLIYPLEVRFWQYGDKFKPLGMSGFKNISDFLIDIKTPLPNKQNVMVLVNGNAQVVWILGLRTDERYKVISTTKKVAIFELSN